MSEKLNTPWNRWNVVLMLIMVNGAFITAVTQFTNQILHDTTPLVHELELTKVARFRTEKGRERAHLQFSFDFDLSKLFDWNCKQVFAFVEASYTLPGRPINRVVVWDDIIHTKEHAAKIRGRNVFAEYEMDDVSQALKGTNISLRLGYDTMPFVGLVGKHFQLRYSDIVSNFTMPDVHGRF